MEQSIVIEDDEVSLEGVMIDSARDQWHEYGGGFHEQVLGWKRSRFGK